MTLFDHRIATIALCAAFALTGTRSISAHHSYVMFDASKQSQVSGAVRNLEWTNPHVWLWITVADGKGAPVLYAFQSTSVNEMSRRGGWTKNIVSSGDKVTVKYNPFKDGRNGGKILAVTLPDGRTLSVDTGIHLPALGAASAPGPTPPAK